MQFTRRLRDAIRLAALLHRSQHRKGEDIPAIHHPYAVAFILGQYVDDEDVVIAGLLHDVLEDVEEATEDQIRELFGERVLSIVLEVTEKKKPGETTTTGKATWEERKRAYLEHLRNGSEEARLVACADKAHNMRDFVALYEVQGPALWEEFNAPKERSIWFYGEVVRVLQETVKNPIVGEIERAFEAYARCTD